MRASLPLGQWLPDQPALNNPGVTVARNCLPRATGYGPLASPTVFSPAMAAMARGAFAAKDKDGNSYTVAGTAAKLYQLTAAAATDRTRVSGGDYSLGDDSYWRFVKWGEDVLATCFDEVIQTLTLGNANFAALAGTPPQARHIAVVRDFVVLGNLYDASNGNRPNAVAWCDAGDNTEWASNQADSQVLYGDGGWVQGIVGGEYGTIFQETSIVRMTYEGPPTFFRFDVVEQNRGVLAAGSIVPVGPLTFYLGQTGFFAFDGTRSRPIGLGRVDHTFLGMVDREYLHRISGAADPINKMVVWAYPSVNAKASGVPDRLLIYDYGHDKWSEAEVDTQRVFSGLTSAIDLDTADNFADDIDVAGAPSLDSRVYSGGELLLGGFSTDHEMTTFNGDAMVARIETAEAQFNPAGLTRLRSARPHADGTVTVCHGIRATQRDVVDYQGLVAPNSYTGAVDLRTTSRFVRMRFDLRDWTEAQAIDVDVMPVGRR